MDGQNLFEPTNDSARYRAVERKLARFWRGTYHEFFIYKVEPRPVLFLKIRYFPVNSVGPLYAVGKTTDELVEWVRLGAEHTCQYLEL
jgi:hypothetical protein